MHPFSADDKGLVNVSNWTTSSSRTLPDQYPLDGLVSPEWVAFHPPTHGDVKGWQHLMVGERGAAGHCMFESLASGSAPLTDNKRLDQCVFRDKLVTALSRDDDLAQFLKNYQMMPANLEHPSVLRKATVNHRTAIENHIRGKSLNGQSCEFRLSHVFQGDQLALVWLMRDSLYQQHNVRVIAIQPASTSQGIEYRAHRVLTNEDRFQPAFEEESATGDWNVFRYILLFNPPGHWQLLGTRQSTNPMRFQSWIDLCKPSDRPKEYVQLLHHFCELPAPIQRQLYDPRHSNACGTRDFDQIQWLKWSQQYMVDCFGAAVEPIWKPGINRLAVSKTTFANCFDALAVALYYEHDNLCASAMQQIKMRESIALLVQTPQDAWSLIEHETAWNMHRFVNQYGKWKDEMGVMHQQWQAQMNKDQAHGQVSLAQLQLAESLVESVRAMIRDYQPGRRFARVPDPQRLTVREALDLVKYHRALWNCSDVDFDKWKRRLSTSRNVFIQQVSSFMNADDSMFRLESPAAAPFRHKLTRLEFQRMITDDIQSESEARRFLDPVYWDMDAKTYHSVVLQPSQAQKSLVAFVQTVIKTSAAFALQQQSLVHLVNGISTTVRTTESKDRFQLQTISIVIIEMSTSSSSDTATATATSTVTEPVRLVVYKPRDLECLPVVLRRYILLIHELSSKQWRLVALPGNGRGESPRVMNVHQLPSWFQHQLLTHEELLETTITLEND